MKLWSDPRTEGGPIPPRRAFALIDSEAQLSRVYPLNPSIAHALAG